METTDTILFSWIWAQAIPAYRSFKQKVSKEPRAMGNQCAKKDDTQRPSPSEPALETGTTQTTQTVVKPEGVIDLSKLVPGPNMVVSPLYHPGCPSWVYVAKTTSPHYQNCNPTKRRGHTSLGPNLVRAKVEPLGSQQEYCTSHHKGAALYFSRDHLPGG